MVDISGRCGAGFGAVKDAFAENFVEEGDVGASVAVAIDGELVVDLWGGTQDAAGRVPWEEDTIINVFSTTKTMTCLSALVLASRGLLDVDAPVATYWPEFAAAGKEGVLVRHLLAHTAGLPGWDVRLDGDRPVRLGQGHRAARRAGDVVGAGLEVRATTGSPRATWSARSSAASTAAPSGTFFAEEIAGPLGADFHIGLGRRARPPRRPRHPAADRADARAGEPVEIPTDSIPYRAANPRLVAEQSWELPWRRAEIPAAGGHGNARSVALAQSVVSAGGIDARRRAAVRGRDRPHLRRPGGRARPGARDRRHVRRRLRPQLAAHPISPNERVCYWGGWGGSLVVNDVDEGMTMAYVMNRMGQGTVGDDRAHRILRAVYASLAD